MKLEINPKENIELSAKQKKEQESGIKKVGSFKYHRGHKVFEYNEDDKTVKECEFFFKENTIDYNIATQGLKTQNKSIKVRSGCVYVKKLNMKNALKHFQGLYGEDVKELLDD